MKHRLVKEALKKMQPPARNLAWNHHALRCRSRGDGRNQAACSAAPGFDIMAAAPGRAVLGKRGFPVTRLRSGCTPRQAPFPPLPRSTRSLPAIAEKPRRVGQSPVSNSDRVPSAGVARQHVGGVTPKGSPQASRTELPPPAAEACGRSRPPIGGHPPAWCLPADECCP